MSSPESPVTPNPWAQWRSATPARLADAVTSARNTMTPG